MNDDELELDIIQRSQMLQNIQAGAAGPGRVPPPIPTTPMLPPTTSPNHPLNMGLLKNQRRAMQALQAQYTNIPNNVNTYGGSFNNYPYRGMTNMNMGGFNPYSAYGQSTNGQYQNPYIIAAHENSRPAFESIQSVVQSFNSISMMLESTFTAMHMSFQALLSVAENFTRLKMFMTKLYSAIVSFRSARWFLTKLLYLLKMVKGGRGSSTEEELWTALSSGDNQKEVIPSDGRSWPVVIFTGILASTPYLIYKLLNSVTPESVSSVDNSTKIPSNMINCTARCDWSSTDPKTIPLVKGKPYLTNQDSLAIARETGWLFVDNFDGKQGYVPLVAFKARNADDRSLDSQIQGTPDARFGPAPSNSIPEQLQPKSSTSVTDINGDPINLPHPMENKSHNI